MYIGQVSKKDDTPALFCTGCNVRIKITLEMVHEGSIEYQSDDDRIIAKFLRHARKLLW